MSIDGQTVTELGVKADPRVHEIAVDGRPLTFPDEIHALMLHKPAGFLSTREDGRHRRTVMDFVPLHLRSLVYPVGRLDYTSTGLLLLTNDGALAFRLTHPSHHVPKTYEVTADRALSETELDALRTGVELEDGLTAPAEVCAHPGHPERLTIVLYEGRKRQIRRMLHALGAQVGSLHRVAMGTLRLGDLPPGSVRPLTPEELAELREAVGLPT